MKRDGKGYWRCKLQDIPEGFLYQFRIDGKNRRPDPASQQQPQGVHGPSAVVDHFSYEWKDTSWEGISLESACIYELHVGAFTEEGTFDAVITRLDHLCELGITAIEIMPVAHFPGKRNWGYDGVHPFAVHTAYGGVKGMKRLVDACHRKGLAVILDVVYNHLGPEGNYIWEYGPYFTRDKYKTPWGWAINYDDAGSDDVRDYFIANALHWMNFFHIDGLRLDAVHSIYDRSAYPFLEQLADAVAEFERQTGKKRFLIAECDLNDPRFITPKGEMGMGLHAQWSDELHHALHVALTGERRGYYEDFGETSMIACALEKGYVYVGQYSRFRKCSFGREPKGMPCRAFVVCSQNHDQVGNRMLGERLLAIAGPEAARLAAAVVLLSPMTPLLFMGEEWGETNPFLYFVDHGDETLCRAVREGRKKEFEAFHALGEAPDPTAGQTFTTSKIDWSSLKTEVGKRMFSFYRECLRLRKKYRPDYSFTFDHVVASVYPENSNVVTMRLNITGNTFFAVMNFGKTMADVPFPFTGEWKCILNSNARIWGGSEVDVPVADSGDGRVSPLCYRLWENRR